MTTRVIPVTFVLEMDDSHPVVQTFLALSHSAQREVLEAVVAPTLSDCGLQGVIDRVNLNHTYLKLSVRNG